MRKKQPASYWRERRLEQRKLKGGDTGPRVCLEQGCTIVLNQYNRNDCCSLHNFAYMKREKKFVSRDL